MANDRNILTGVVCIKCGQPTQVNSIHICGKNYTGNIPVSGGGADLEKTEEILSKITELLDRISRQG